MSRRIFILHKREDVEIIGINDEEMLELLCPPYGVCDGGDYWGIKIHFHVEKNLEMSPTTGETALYLKMCDGKLEGLIRIYVDEKLHVGYENFEKDTLKSLIVFDS